MLAQYASGAPAWHLNIVIPYLQNGSDTRNEYNGNTFLY